MPVVEFRVEIKRDTYWRMVLALIILILLKLYWMVLRTRNYETPRCVLSISRMLWRMMGSNSRFLSSDIVTEFRGYNVDVGIVQICNIPDSFKKIVIVNGTRKKVIFLQCTSSTDDREKQNIIHHLRAFQMGKNIWKKYQKLHHSQQYWSGYIWWFSPVWKSGRYYFAG